MAQYTIYDKTTGAILRSGVAPDSMVALQVVNPTTEGYVAGQAGNDLTQEVVVLGGTSEVQLKE